MAMATITTREHSDGSDYAEILHPQGFRPAEPQITVNALRRSFGDVPGREASSSYAKGGIKRL